MKKQYRNPNKDEEGKIALKDLKVRWKSDYGITMIAFAISRKCVRYEERA